MANNNTLFIGKVLQRYSSLVSTNATAKELLSKSSPIEGTVISASFQTAGKGQIGSNWESAPDSNLLLSIILYPNIAAFQTFELNIFLSLAVRNWAREWIPQPVEVKWPNDIMVNNQKLAGLLIQNSFQGSKLQYSILGIGINVNQAQFETYNPPATSLRLLANTEFDLETLEQSLFASIEQYYLKLKQGKINQLRTEYLSHLWNFRQAAIFQPANGNPFRGMISGIDKQGKLLIQTADEERAFGMKEVKLVRNEK
ncbi:MAG: biotin--[acetyl-CoA-carboxylase] ligase [Bacteroidetes bacterium]|nr:biotin--[acetyl-CoA-carboxylase] ligase [Bacteroidota bacterium]